MFSVLAALLALGGFLVAEASAPLAVGVVVAVSLAAIACAALGVRVGHHAPALAAYLTRFWSVFVAVAVGAIGVAAAVAKQWAAPPDAATSTAVAFALVAAAVGAAIEGSSRWLAEHHAGWFAGRWLCRRYGPAFPALPGRAGPGEQAYRAVEAACRSGAPSWSLATTEAVLEAVRRAYEAGEHPGGGAWVDPRPPTGGRPAAASGGEPD